MDDRAPQHRREGAGILVAAVDGRDRALQEVGVQPRRLAEGLQQSHYRLEFSGIRAHKQHDIVSIE
jgi:hypothetical protein